MKWFRIAVWVVVECLKAVQRGWSDGRVEVAEKRQRELFDRANSGDETPLDKRSGKG